MRKYLFTILFSLFVFIGFSCSTTGNQVNSSSASYAEVPMPNQLVSEEFPQPDEWAKYPGGNEALQSHIQMNTIIPEEARIEGYNGRLVMTYVVNTEGVAGQIETLMSPHEAITSMYEKIIADMERWEPAILNGEPVQQQYAISAYFNDNTSQ
jgi:hypothetical protein